MIIFSFLFRMFWKTFFIKLLLIPVLFVMGGVLACVGTMDLSRLGRTGQQVTAAINIGEKVASATEDMTILEVNCLRILYERFQYIDGETLTARVHDIKECVRKYCS